MLGVPRISTLVSIIILISGLLQGGHPTPSCASSGSNSGSSDGVKGDIFPGSRFPGKMEQRGGEGGGGGGGGGGGLPQHPKLLERASLPADFLWNQQHQSQLLSANRYDPYLTFIQFFIRKKGSKTVSRGHDLGISRLNFLCPFSISFLFDPRSWPSCRLMCQKS